MVCFGSVPVDHDRVPPGQQGTRTGKNPSFPRETSCPIPVIGGCGSSRSQRLTASSRRPWKRPASSTKLQSVERAGGVSHWLLYVGVDHSGLQTTVPGQQLDRADIGAVRQQVRGERVSQGMHAGMLA